MKKTIFSLLILLLTFTWIIPTIAEQTINNCPVPDDMKIVEPDKNEVPPKLALLAGIWEGNWGLMSVLFIVENINSKEAVVIQSVSGRQAKTKKATAIEGKYSRKTCRIEQGEDGNYQIIMVMGQGTNKLIQTDDPRYIRVKREGFGGLSADSQDSVFRKKEMN